MSMQSNNHRTAKFSSRARSNRRVGIERLEAREMMTVYYYGGQVMPHVETQALYLGQDWYYNASLYQRSGNVEQFLNTIVHSTYMDMLTRAGYGVGRGSFDAGRIDLLNINKAYYLTDTAIRQQVQAFISNGNLKAPDSNRLYVVYVEPGVAIMNDHDNNSTSVKDFLGYHGAFAGRDIYGNAADIRYAVIAYPGGYNFTSQRNGLPSDFAQLTEVTSHELSEAVTDPNVNYRTLGWYDPQKGEIGDIVNLQTFYLNGYVVQKESDKYDRAITPTTFGLTTTSIASSSTTGAFSTASASLRNESVVGHFSLQSRLVANLIDTLWDGHRFQAMTLQSDSVAGASIKHLHHEAVDALFGGEGGPLG
jgi:hypothetical protein